MDSQQKGTQSREGDFWFRAMRELRNALDELVQSGLSLLPEDVRKLIEDAPQSMAEVESEGGQEEKGESS